MACIKQEISYYFPGKTHTQFNKERGKFHTWNPNDQPLGAYVKGGNRRKYVLDCGNIFMLQDKCLLVAFILAKLHLDYLDKDMTESGGDGTSKKYRLLFGTKIKKGLSKTKKLQQRLLGTVDLLLEKYPSIKDGLGGICGPFIFENVCTALIKSATE